MLTDHEWQEAQDGLCLLLCWVVALWCDQLLAGVLADHQQGRQHQVGACIMPADGGVAVHKGEQPGQTAALGMGTKQHSRGSKRVQQQKVSMWS